ncbi:hypothetical protein AWB78_04251 [Caballeronia calidae]|uniref:Uncharacterized protein n=1 Tax=Caballeronia calidae TaxID=1777139 RepID=A0A158CRB1_9BURK|nr:hypothetical protein AWB78_04251 [Caballeronia calidae]
MSKLFLPSASFGLVEHFHRKSHVLSSLLWLLVRSARRMRHGRFHASRLRQFPLLSEGSSATPLGVQAIVRCTPHVVV